MTVSSFKESLQESQLPDDAAEETQLDTAA